MILWTLKYDLRGEGGMAGVYVQQIPAPTRGQAEALVRRFANRNRYGVLFLDTKAANSWRPLPRIN